MTRSPISPRLLHRATGALTAPGWRRVALLRRAAAGVLCLLALLLALAPRAGPDGGATVVVAGSDLPAGATIRAADLVVRTWPADLVPVGAVAEPAAADGRVLVGATRAGEPLTDVRLVGAGPGPSGSEEAAVPVRLADAGVAPLLTPGRRVDVVSVGGTGDPVVLAAGAAVLAVLPQEEARQGRLVLVGMPPALAARVAAASLTDQVAITLR